MVNTVLRVDPKDNVVVCLRTVEKGEVVSVDGVELTAAERIQQYHKMAVEPIAKGEYCYKYGNVIGVAVMDIERGGHVHVHNVESTRGRGDKKAKGEGEI